MSFTIVCLHSNKKYFLYDFHRSVEWPVDRHIQCAGQVKILHQPVAMVRQKLSYSHFFIFYFFSWNQIFVLNYSQNQSCSPNPKILLELVLLPIIPMQKVIPIIIQVQIKFFQCLLNIQILLAIPCLHIIGKICVPEKNITSS